MTNTPLPAETLIGHVHLKVADLERAIGFYRDLLGFDLLVNLGTAAFLSAGGYHHHIGLNTWESQGGAPPALGTTGLYHFAINYPTRRDLAAALVRLLDGGWGIDGASDHGTHEATTRMPMVSSWPVIDPGRSGRSATGYSSSTVGPWILPACSRNWGSRIAHGTWRFCPSTHRWAYGCPAPAGGAGENDHW